MWNERIPELTAMPSPCVKMSDSWQVLAKGLQNKNGNLPQIAIAVVTPPLKGVGSFPLYIK